MVLYTFYSLMLFTLVCKLISLRSHLTQSCFSHLQEGRWTVWHPLRTFVGELDNSQVPRVRGRAHMPLGRHEEDLHPVGQEEHLLAFLPQALTG